MKSTQVPFVAPFGQQLLERIPTMAVAPKQQPRRILLALVVVVARRTVGEDRRSIDFDIAEMADIGILRLSCGLDHGAAAPQRLAKNIGDMLDLPVELLGRARVEAALDIAGEEQVRKVAGHHTMQ